MMEIVWIMVCERSKKKSEFNYKLNVSDKSVGMGMGSGVSDNIAFGSDALVRSFE